MTGSVLDMTDQRVVGARQLEDACGEIAVLDLLATADVVDASWHPFAQDQLDPGAVVLNVEPIACLATVAIDGERLSVQGVRDEKRDDLLGILVRTVGVRAASNRSVDAVGSNGGEYLEVAARLRGCVRARRAERIVFARGAAFGHVAVDLVGRDLNEAQAVLPRVVEENVGAQDIRLDELSGAEDRAVDMGLCREVEDRLTARGYPCKHVAVGDGPLNELDVGAIEVRPIARVGELVEHDNLVASGGQAFSAVRADEPGSAGNENTHRRKPRGRTFGLCANQTDVSWGQKVTLLFQLPCPLAAVRGVRPLRGPAPHRREKPATTDRRPNERRGGSGTPEGHRASVATSARLASRYGEPSRRAGAPGARA